MSTRIVTFFKDWGGVLTVVIAIVYTFPIGILDRISSSEEKLLSMSRQVLADGSSMVVEKTLNIAKVNDTNSLDIINRMYNIKFYNLISSNSILLAKTVDKLRSSEIATFAGLLVFSGNIADALPYYDAAIRKARAEKLPYPNILRDRSQVLFAPGPTQNIDLGRDGYKEILELASRYTGVGSVSGFTTYLSELAYHEAVAGDWLCGSNLYRQSDTLFKSVRTNDPQAARYHDAMREMFTRLKPNSKQSQQGCPYTIPAPPT